MIRVQITRTRGSTPRAAGCEMWVGPDHIEGTIGGGALEWEAMRLAREMLASGTKRREAVMPLGPSLGQCCGGSVTLALDHVDHIPLPAKTPLFIWGGGHVGRAIAQVLGGAETFDVHMVDTMAERTTAPLPDRVETVIVADMTLLARSLGPRGHHLILTYSHDLDLALCDALLRRDTLSIGLIGSETKWARFQSRLKALGHSGAEISAIQCPIGDPTLGKAPHSIAVGVAADLLRRDMPVARDAAEHTTGGAAG